MYKESRYYLKRSLDEIQDISKIKKKLINSFLYLTCYEKLKESIINQVKGIYITSNSPKNLSLKTEKQDYYREVLSLDRDKL